MHRLQKGMRVVAALFPLKINGRIAGVLRWWCAILIVALKTLLIRPSLDQRTVHAVIAKYQVVQVSSAISVREPTGPKQEAPSDCSAPHRAATGASPSTRRVPLPAARNPPARHHEARL